MLIARRNYNPNDIRALFLSNFLSEARSPAHPRCLARNIRLEKMFPPVGSRNGDRRLPITTHAAAHVPTYV